ncbi:MAG: coenzyme F420-0:L-glutamate ligase / coenzyme F420:gamma-L-glutamate ligase [Chloroflexota bacterium]|nr:coenzyme F420-0:L-glutamate ligase / coenzyme F420:gamma-L-glutamate ligase [Chloroflexota bacterium]
MSLVIQPIKAIPLIHMGDDLCSIISAALEKESIALQDQDILVVTQKIISKAEGRLVNIAEVEPSQKALELAEICEKDPRLVEVILSESNEVVRVAKGTLIVEHKLGFVCANAGVDHSNIDNSQSEEEILYLKLPENPDESARKIRTYFKEQQHVNIGVMVIDSHGRAWREGIVGIMIGTAGVPALEDMRGALDLFGEPLRITQIGAADELAAASSLVMGQADEHIPVVHVRGFPYALDDDAQLSDLIREKEKDLFR